MHDFWLKALAAIAEDLGSVLRAKTKTNKKKPQKQTTTTTKNSQWPITLLPGLLEPFSGSMRQQTHGAHT